MIPESILPNRDIVAENVAKGGGGASAVPGELLSDSPGSDLLYDYCPYGAMNCGGSEGYVNTWPLTWAGRALSMDQGIAGDVEWFGDSLRWHRQVLKSWRNSYPEILEPSTIAMRDLEVYGGEMIRILYEDGSAWSDDLWFCSGCVGLMLAATLPVIQESV